MTNDFRSQPDKDQSSALPDQDSDIDLYDELVAFSELPPEQQVNRAEETEHKGLENPSGAPIADNPFPVLNELNYQTLDDTPANERPEADFFGFELAAAEPVAAAEGKEVSEADSNILEDFKAGDPITSPLRFSIDNTTLTLTRCPTCGEETDSLDMFCIKCGVFLQEAKMDESGDEEVLTDLDVGNAGPQVYDLSVSSCFDCGAIVAPDEVFCPSCGSVLPE